ncbi:MAG: Cobalt-zinc-cadmium resistance protein CzcA [bacterium]|nr:Cobalt-zinc-cadmium resistance protein CzcA [bacterium]
MRFLTAVVGWSLRNRPIVLFLTVIFVAFGLRAAWTLPIDAVPDITNVQVQVITSAPALSPIEIEQYVTVPIERAMAGIPHGTQVRSLSRYGISVVTIVFTDDTDIYFARQQAAERLPAAEAAMSGRYGKPALGPLSTGLGEIYQFFVENDRLSLMQRKELLDWYIAPQLRLVTGVVDVNGIGGEVREYQVTLDPLRLAAANVSLGEVIVAIDSANANAGGGYIEHNQEQLVIGSNGLLRNLDDLRRVVVRTAPDGSPLTVGMLGEVAFGPRLRRGAATRDTDGEDVVGLALLLRGENARTVTDAVKARVAALQPSLPKGTRIVPFYDRSVLVNRTIRTVIRNLSEGAALVILVLFLLLGDLRAGLVVAMMIPLALLFAILGMRFLHLSGNLMSLGAIDFGMLVDGAVIIVENSVRRLNESAVARCRPLNDAERVAIVDAATVEVRAATLFGEAMVAIVYLPILELSGIEGKLFRPMATTVVLALLGAFVMTLTVVPVLTSLLARPHPGHEETWLVRHARRLYRPLLGRAMRHHWLTVGASVLLLAAAVALFSRLGAEFVPQLDEGDILVEARSLPGVALSEEIALSTRAAKALLPIPEVRQVVGKTGSPDVATEPMGINETDLWVLLKPREQWRAGLTKDALASQISDVLSAKVPEFVGGISQPIQMRTNELIAGVKSDAAALLYGDNLDELVRLAGALAARIRTVPGAADVKVEQVAGLRYLRIVPDRARLARHGLTIDDVNRLTEALSVGAGAGEVLEGDRRFSIVVKARSGYRGNVHAIGRLPLKTPVGRIVPLAEVAEVREETGPAQVSRQDQSRRISIEFNVRGRDLMSVVRDAQSQAAATTLPAGYRIEWGGQFQHYSAAKARLFVVVPIALGLIGILLWLTFRSMRFAFIIFLNVPFAVIGGVVALWLRSIPFSISAGVGFIALFGVAVLNGLVLVAFARHLEGDGHSHDEAIRMAADERLRPVLMTALVASLGFVPMALSRAPGSEVQRPLATVVIGGLITATALTLFVLPVVYAYFGRLRR